MPWPTLPPLLRDAVGLKHLDRKAIDAAVTEELARAAAAGAGARPSQALVDVGAIRERLLHYGWVKDARVLRRLPDTLVIDIVERTPAALWQNKGQLALIDAEGVVLDRVPVDKMPDLPGWEIASFIRPARQVRKNQLRRQPGLTPADGRVPNDAGTAGLHEPI